MRGGPEVRALLVEDDPADAEYIRELLSGEKVACLELLHVDRLSRALELLGRGEFDVVLLDLGLPESHGLDTLERMREAVRKVPVIVLTGLDDEAVATKAVQEGAQDYLPKGELDGKLLVRSIRYAVERHRLLEAQRALSLNDELTGLYNRRGFTILARQQLGAVQRMGKRQLLLFADLDSMKWINDNLGHKEGDRALIDAATVLINTFRREADIIGRMGGDEFAVLSLEQSRTGGRTYTDLLQRNVEAFVTKNSRPYRLSLSVGTAQYDPECPLSLDELLSRADSEMYKEKARKKGLNAVRA
jgi:diguanylate cyclase (GGDEF)-like protein